MATSQIAKVSYHARSHSVPSASHPIVHQFDEQLCRLRSSEAASTSSSSLNQRLIDLVELYCSVDELLQLPSTQEAAQQIQVMLDGSVRLLDICSTSRDILMQSKERLQDIQSVLRRKFSCDRNITKEVVEYLNIRKNSKKAVKNCLKNIKESLINDNANEGKLRDVEEVTLDIFRSLLSYVGGTPQKSNWSIVTKLIHNNGDKKVEALTSEFDAVDATLNSLMCQKKKSGINMSQVEYLKSQLVKLELEIQHLDEVLECLFRHLIKTRATLLNILSN